MTRGVQTHVTPAILSAAIFAVMLATSTTAGGQDRQLRELPRLMDVCSSKACEFLLGTISADGASSMEYPAGDWRRGGPTATTVWALLSVNVNPTTSPKLKSAMEWLGREQLTGTFPLAMRIRAFSASRVLANLDTLESDVRRLIAAIGSDGGYKDYPESKLAADNFNTHCAAMAIYASQTVGMYVPQSFWEKMQKYWLAKQMPDGGWGFRSDVAGLAGQSSGQMTAAGLTCLYACRENMPSVDLSGAIDKATAWLDKNFSASQNPARGPEWISHWWNNFTESQQFDGFPTGQQKIIACTTAIIDRQLRDGGFDGANRATETALALVSLSRCRSPILITRLILGQPNDNRRSDAANVTRLLGAKFERMLCWQTSDFTAVADWQNSPILYIRGKGRFAPSAASQTAMKEYILRGGLILTEAMDADASFTLDVQTLMKNLFPQYSLAAVGAESELFTGQDKLTNPPQMMCISNGVRMLMLHCPVDLSAALNAGASKDNTSAFNFMSNLSILVTDKLQIQSRWSNLWPDEGQNKPAITIARVRYEGNWNPEPLAWSRFSNLLAARKSLAVNQMIVDLEKLDAAKHRIAHMTGTKKFAFSAAQRDALKKFVNDGGTLIVDPAGSSEDFAKFIAERIPTIVGGQLQQLAKDDPLATSGPYNLSRIQYRIASRMRLLNPPTQPPPAIHTILLNNRQVVIVFDEDITAGLVGYQRLDLRGFAPQSAYEVMANVIIKLSSNEKK